MAPWSRWRSAIWFGLALVSISACNVFDRELPVVDRPDAPSDATSSTDAALDAPTDTAGDPPLTCDPTKPFGTAVLVDGLTSSSEDGSLRLSPDEKTAYFFSARSGHQLLYTASRSRVFDPFDHVAVLANVNTGNQYNPSITADGLTLFFASFRAEGVGDNDIYQATRSTTATPDFGDVHPAPNVNTLSSEVQPYVAHDGTTLYFNRTVASRATLFRATGSVAGGFRNAGAITELVGPLNDSDPVPSADGLTLFWSSDRPNGAGDLDVWQAQRPTTSDPFQNPAPVVSVNTAGLDAPSDISANGCRLYMTSTRNGRTGIYVATRPQ